MIAQIEKEALFKKRETYLRELPENTQEKLKAAIQEQTITSLDLNGDQLSDEHIIAIAALLHLTAVNTLNVGANDIGVEGACALATSPTLTSLNLGFNHIGADGARALSTSPTLKILNVSYNNIGSDGAIALAGNQVLSDLYVDGNDIRNDGACALAANNTLRFLSVNWNHIGVIGANAFIENKALRKMNISWNRIGDSCLREIKTMLGRNSRWPLTKNAGSLKNGSKFFKSKIGSGCDVEESRRPLQK